MITLECIYILIIMIIIIAKYFQVLPLKSFFIQSRANVKASLCVLSYLAR